MNTVLASKELSSKEMAMFCFQCEQTNKGCCTSFGVCGKDPDCSELQDQIVAALIDLACSLPAADQEQELKAALNPETKSMVRDALFTTVTNVNFDPEVLKDCLAKIKAATPGTTDIFSMDKIWDAQEDIRSLKSLLLYGIKGTAAYAHHAANLSYEDERIDLFFIEALQALSQLDYGLEELLPLVMKCGEVNLICMELLDRANTESYGNPVPTQVSSCIEAGPFIVMSGHDLHDLKLLLEQSKDSGVNIYTHGEMLPAHAYPELKKYPHLKGNFGTAWQNQQKEFDKVPGVFLFNTNCIQKPRESYKDRVFTTGEVCWPGCQRLNDKDFSPAIQKALELGGYAEDQHFSGINGGTEMTVGFGRQTILDAAGAVVEAVKAGEISHFFLVGGCDGAKPGRNYYTEFVKQCPKDSVILTLACGKYRFNDLDLGSVAGLPRLMDMGQCNDAYGAIMVALALSEAFDCSVNDLPLTLVLSWYEQKAVCILLSLLYLGIKGIYLGPSLPAFISPSILEFLVENYDIRPISSPEEDLKQILG